MRRKDREISREAAWQVADECLWATLSMVDPEGKPYCVAVNPAREGESIYFHCAREGFKTDCLRANPEVCLSCVTGAESVRDKLTMAYRSAILRGRAHEVTDESERIRALTLLARRYDPDSLYRLDASLEKYMAHTAVWRIDISDITGKHGHCPA